MKERYVAVLAKPAPEARLGLAKQEFEVPFGAKDDAQARRKLRRFARCKEVIGLYKFVKVEIK